MICLDSVTGALWKCVTSTGFCTTVVNISGTAANSSELNGQAASYYAPLATPVFTTNITTPIVYGGSAAGSTLTLQGTSNGSPSNAYVILQPSGGKVGIGTTAPSNLLTVSGVGVPMLVHSSGVYTGIQMTSSGDVNGGVGFVEGYDSFQVQPGGNYALNVSSNGSISVGKSYGSMGGPADGAIFQGHVGIGMTTPASTLTVNGHIGTDGLAPALTSCGTSPSIVAGSTDTAGEVTEGSLATGCTITFKTAYARAPFVTISAQSGLVFSYTISASAITITNVGALSSTILDYHVISNDE